MLDFRNEKKLKRICCYIRIVAENRYYNYLEKE